MDITIKFFKRSDETSFYDTTFDIIYKVILFGDAEFSLPDGAQWIEFDDTLKSNYHTISVAPKLLIDGLLFLSQLQEELNDIRNKEQILNITINQLMHALNNKCFEEELSSKCPVLVGNFVIRESDDSFSYEKLNPY